MEDNLRRRSVSDDGVLVNGPLPWGGVSHRQLGGDTIRPISLL